MRYIFNDCVLDTERHELRQADEPVRLRPKVFQLLAYLIAHRNRVISKQELFEQLWPQRVVGDATLNSCVMELRRAIGDRGELQHTIKTLHGQGYRLVASVVEQPHPAPAAEPEGDPVEALTDHNPADAPTLDERREPPVSAGDGGRMLWSSPADAADREYKQVTVLACAVADATLQASRLGAEAMDELMQEFFGLAKRAMAHYQGTVTEWLGDGFTALFGAPVALEDHGRRAVLAALELGQLIKSSEVIGELTASGRLRIRTGLHTGPVIVGRLNASPDQIYTAVGDTTDLAARVRDLASPGALLISETTCRLVHTEVQAEHCDAVDVPGDPTPVPVYSVQSIVQRRAGVPQRGERALSRFVGRERELAILHERLSRAEAGESQVVSVSGEPGIGKSRLLRELRRGLIDKPITCLEGHCLSYGSATPYLPVLVMLRDICGITETDTPNAITTRLRKRLHASGINSDEAEHLLLDLLGVPVDQKSLERLSPEVRKTRTFGYLRQVIMPNIQRQSCVLVLEDLHWIDATSEEWLAQLVDRLTGARLMLLVTYRPGYRPPWLERSSATQLALPRLTSRDSTALVLSVPGAPKLSDRLAREIVTKANGNPFFLEELAWTMGVDPARRTPPNIPNTIQAVLAARMDELSPTDKRLLQRAAVIGMQIPLALLEVVSNRAEKELHGALGRLQAAEFLYELLAGTERIYTFKHALTREVAYQSLLARTRQELHRNIAEVLEKRFPDTVSHQPELLAHHYTEAGLARPAVGYWQQAGQRAIARSANSEAIAHLQKGLEVLKGLPQSPERAELELGLQISLGVPLLVTKGPGSTEVEQAYVRARELCRETGNRRKRFLTLWGLWRLSKARAQMQTVRQLADELLSLAQESEEPALLLQAHHARWTTLRAFGEFASALHHTEQGIALYSRSEHATQAFVIAGHDPCVCGHSTAALILWALGYPDQALKRNDQALLVARELDHPYSLAAAEKGAAELHQLRREMEAVREHAQTLIELADQHAAVGYLPLAGILKEWALKAREQTEDGVRNMRRNMREALRMVGKARNYAEAPYAACLVAEAYARTNRPERGLSLLREALIATEKSGEQYWDAELHRLTGELLFQQGAPDVEAEECFHQALALARRQQTKSLELRAAMSLARLWRDQGKQKNARDLLARIYNWFTEGFDTGDLRDAKELLRTLP